MSFMGKGVTKSTILCLLHLSHEMVARGPSSVRASRAARPLRGRQQRLRAAWRAVPRGKRLSRPLSRQTAFYQGVSWRLYITQI